MSEANSPISPKTSPHCYPPNPPSELSPFTSPPVITLPTQGKPLSAATLQNPVTPSPNLPTKPQIPIPPPPMLRFGDIITDWLPVAQPYLEQAPPNQRVALLYTLLETTLRQHVHAQLGTTNTTLEATIAAIKFVFRITQPIGDPLGDFFSRRQQVGEPLLGAYPPCGTSLPSRRSPAARV